MDSEGAALPTGLGPLELARYVVAQIDAGNGYARNRKVQFMRRASVLRILALLLSTSATVILGLQDLDFWTGLGFALVAVATAVTAVEPYFAWRSRWVLMEEMQHQFHRLADHLRYHVASRPESELSVDEIQRVYDEYQGVWDRISAQWLEHRRHGDSRS